SLTVTSFCHLAPFGSKTETKSLGLVSRAIPPTLTVLRTAVRDGSGLYFMRGRSWHERKPHVSAPPSRCASRGPHPTGCVKSTAYKIDLRRFPNASADTSFAKFFHQPEQLRRIGHFPLQLSCIGRGLPVSSMAVALDKSFFQFKFNH